MLLGLLDKPTTGCFKSTLCLLKLKLCLGAVSYTHLDVYKRQDNGANTDECVGVVRNGTITGECNENKNNEKISN